MRTFPPPLPVTLFSVTLLSGFHLLGEELTESHSFNCHKQLQVKSEAELRSVQNTLKLLNQSLSVFTSSVSYYCSSRSLDPSHCTLLCWEAAPNDGGASQFFMKEKPRQLFWFRKPGIMGNIQRSVVFQFNGTTQ